MWFRCWRLGYCIILLILHLLTDRLFSELTIGLVPQRDKRRVVGLLIRIWARSSLYLQFNLLLLGWWPWRKKSRANRLLWALSMGVFRRWRLANRQNFWRCHAWYVFEFLRDTCLLCCHWRLYFTWLLWSTFVAFSFWFREFFLALLSLALMEGCLLCTLLLGCLDPSH